MPRAQVPSSQGHRHSGQGHRGTGPGTQAHRDRCLRATGARRSSDTRSQMLRCPGLAFVTSFGSSIPPVRSSQAWSANGYPRRQERVSILAVGLFETPLQTDISKIMAANKIDTAKIDTA